MPAISPVMNELEKLAERLAALPNIYQDVAEYELSAALARVEKHAAQYSARWEDTQPALSGLDRRERLATSSPLEAVLTESSDHRGA